MSSAHFLQKKSRPEGENLSSLSWIAPASIIFHVQGHFLQPNPRVGRSVVVGRDRGLAGTGRRCPRRHFATLSPSDEGLVRGPDFVPPPVSLDLSNEIGVADKAILYLLLGQLIGVASPLRARTANEKGRQRTETSLVSLQRDKDP